MKKLLIIWILVPVVLAGCSTRSGKSDKKEEEMKEFSVVGESYAAIDYLSSDRYRVYRFIDDMNVEETRRYKNPKGKIAGDIHTGTYILEYPKITIIINDDYSEKERKYEGEFIDKNTFRMNIYNKIIEYTKQ